MKKVRLLTWGLVFTLAFGQTAQAANYIVPFGATQAYQENSVMLPSASYSTKEPITIPGIQMNPTVPGTQNNQTGSAGLTTQTTASQTTVSQTIVPQTAVSADTIKELEKAAAAAEIKIPEISAKGAVLYDVTHDRFLFEKGADESFYPASITKLLTALLVLENAKMDEMVTFSQTAVTKLESGAVTLQLQAGDKVSVKDCLYGLMLKSANEVANGLAEHVGGSLEGFAQMMNDKAKALGCTGSNFVNPNGLNDKNHYTTARDMAKIAKAAFANEELCKITSTTSYKFPATKAAKERTISLGHKMVYKSDSRHYHGIIGGKTGYTSLAGNTLVTCVERDGVRMIAVILKSSGTHYTDTTSLLDYGYALNEKGILIPGTSSGQTVAVANPNSSAAQSSNPGTAQNAGPSVVQTGATAQNAGPGATQTTTAYHKWIADGNIWRFELADGTRLSNCFVTIDGYDYAFDTEGRMVTGWLALGENWHYFDNSGAMVKNGWRQDNALWFYLGENGAMVKNAWIDGQYYVGADGVWVE